MTVSTNTVGFLLKLYICVFLTFIVISQTEALGCWQCGTFHRGKRDECWIADRQLYNCTACLKTYTRTYLHDSWRKFQYTSKESKTCIPKHSYSRKAGCYTKTSASGYMEQCYCYDNFCNTGSVFKSNLFILFGCINTLLVFYGII